MSIFLKQTTQRKNQCSQLINLTGNLKIRRFLRYWIHFYEDWKSNLLHVPIKYPNIINNMSLFGYTLEETSSEIDSWVSEIRENLNHITNKKAEDYGFDFTNEIPRTSIAKRFEWEEIPDDTKPSCGFYSSFRNSYARSSLSTMPSLDADQVEEIPKILDLNLRVSLESENVSDFSLKNQQSI
ncbi:unnamed protein product [Blepharisma stoltei]|uniref:Cyclin-dependent kinase inhibitor domain-containing protein n=1 Tax=Blepharisma stoltei TaxID=1481888 RepID=A0AAU9JUT2_9CILI|nr:unnamed protein product [Blepharisma stoltei]